MEEKAPTITIEDRIKLKLFVGTRVPNKPIVAQCGDDRVERLKGGEVIISIGYYSDGQKRRREWAGKKLMEAFLKGSLLSKYNIPLSKEQYDGLRK